MRTLISAAPLYPSPPPSQPTPTLQTPLSLSRREFLAYLPLLFKLLSIRREKSCETVAFSPGANCISTVYVECQGGGQGGASGLLSFGGCFFVLFTLLGLFQPCVLKEEGRLG